MIKVTNLSKTYDSSPVLQDINFELNRGEIVALMGGNGSGKSTLLRCVSLLERSDQGEIEFLMNKYSFDTEQSTEVISPWPDITLVFQQFFLWPHLTVIENILLPLRSRFPLDYDSKIKAIIKRFSLLELINKFPNQISVGQKQKVALARAIGLEPKVLFLDEITSALDNIHAIVIANILKEESSRGTSIVLVTHSVNYAIYCADRYLVLEGGRLVESELISSIKQPQSIFLKNSMLDNGYLI
jgi:ABC-type polar amino acid transport system ATPase subunit